MKSSDIRQSFVDFFVDEGHLAHASSPLVPHGDPTLLFANAGMVQFKDAFLGATAPPADRVVTVQKCMRVSGKHNDLENVGPSARHHTFFEMLGNFSFGDYFKEDAIRFAWDLVTGVWGLNPEHLFATVFEEDDQAAALWARLTSLPGERVLRCGAADNFWAMGDTGPCGPCSEIFVDRHPDRPHVDWAEGSENGRYLEIWNLVFMQYDRQPGGELLDLPNPSIDTGSGLERVASVMQGVESNYDTDLFQPILRATATLAGVEYGADEHRDTAMRVIADHLRATAFLLADGVIPHNEGRGYVLRRLLRRALRHGIRLGFEEPFLHRLLPVVGEVMAAHYSELDEVERASTVTVETEEEKFLSTVATGSAQVQAEIERVVAGGDSVLPGPTAFRLYDTYGLPIELIREIAEEERVGVDEPGFERALEEQRSRSRAAADEGGGRLTAAREALREGGRLAPTGFTGYRELELDAAEVQAIAKLSAGGAERVEQLGAGENGVVVLDRTPFYAEAGGQVGDRGGLSWPGGTAVVNDTQKDKGGTHLHFIEVVEGPLRAGERVRAAVDASLRRPTQRNHTATHLLQAALRHVLGAGVRQAGSLVAPDRLRFDFTYGKPIDGASLARIEGLVNDWILLARPTEITEDRPYEEAVAAGAMALFGEKYGDRVRTVEIADLELGAGGGDRRLGSLELCGGCHVFNSGEIGPFVIITERGVASGVRRIEALTGEKARAYLAERLEWLEATASELGVPPETVAVEVEKLRTRNRELESELARLRMQLVSGAAQEDSEIEISGVRVVVREVPAAPVDEIRRMADVLRDRLGSGVVVLASRDGEKVSLVATVSKDLTDRLNAGALARRVAAIVDGKGGGRPDFAQAGGRRPEMLPEALTAVPDMIREELGAG